LNTTFVTQPRCHKKKTQNSFEEEIVFTYKFFFYKQLSSEAKKLSNY